MRIYEELFIAKPDAPEEEIDALVTQLQTTIESSGGRVEKVEKWGSRRLAYKIQKYSDGQYVLILFHCDANVVKEVERRLRVADVVIKYLTSRMDEKLKWIEKRKKEREKRAARKPAPAAAVPAPPMAPGAPEAAGPVPGAPMPGAPVTPAATGEKQ
jgi:small subunit ribosomal protein S6